MNCSCEASGPLFQNVKSTNLCEVTLFCSCSATCCNNFTYNMNCNKPVTPTCSRTRSFSKQRERRDFVHWRWREWGRSAGWTAACGRVWPLPPLLRGYWTWCRDAAALSFHTQPRVKVTDVHSRSLNWLSWCVTGLNLVNWFNGGEVDITGAWISLS